MALTTLQPLGYATSYMTFLFGTASIFLRFYCRYFVLQTWGVDDFFAVLVLVVSIAQQVNLHGFLYSGCGLHIETLSITQQLQILKWLFVEEVVYYTVHWVIKFAFLFFYLRLSPNKTFRMFVWVGMGLNGVIWVINVLIACLQCMPFDEIFHPGTHPDPACINTLALLIAPSILNIILDFYILLLPIATVLHLQMPPRRKIAVLGIIAFGSSSPIIACVRLYPLLLLNSSPDKSWVLGSIVIIAGFEIQFAVIAVNLPSLKALYMRFTGEASTVSNGKGRDGRSGRKGYKLNSFGRSGKSRSERGIMSTESEEDLFRQSGTKIDGAATKITRDCSVKSAGKEDGGALPGHFVVG